MDFLRRWLTDESGPPPDQASTAPLDPHRIPEALPESPRGHLQFGADWIRGTEREKNDDAYLILSGRADGNDGLPDFGLFGLSDGVGGTEGGARASGICLKSLARSLTQGAILDILSMESSSAPTSLEELVRLAVQQANRDVRARVENGAATLTVALVAGDQVVLGHVGDSRAYLIAEGEITQLTRDHSLVKELVDTGTITEEEALKHPQRSVLWNTIGKAIDVKVDVATLTAPPDSVLLLCSDGLWGVVPEQEILAAFQANPSPQTFCEALINKVREASGPDNASAVAVGFPPPAESLV